MGDYIYERFTPDRFQSFCSALLSKDNPDYQVFPVGQADGGRDGVVPGKGPKKSMVIQVKFKRQIKVNEDYFAWLKAAVQKEKPSIDKLIANGAEKYKLVTNVPGTGKDGVGTMDKLREYLASTFSIPVQVLWRDDLDARLSNNYDLKWFYSEILATPDVVRQLFEQGLGSDHKRRFKAISGFITSQYDEDAHVKFKQADLQASDLLNLFIDVPGDLPPQLKLSAAARKDVADMLYEILAGGAGSSNSVDDHALWAVRSWASSTSQSPYAALPSFPAGSMLLHPTAAKRFPRVLVEGAPGQGKSTLAQYLCQVHRMHFLGIEDDLSRIPAVHRLSPIRIPFKIDLRDLASWIDGIDPRKPLAAVEHNQPTSLESFMAAEVRYLSGGQDFSVSDLHELATSTPILVVLDGFDEIATPTQRALVVREIDKGLGRLAEGALSIQAVVTSRPSAMPNSPTFNRSVWTNVALSSITSDLALEYAGRWSAARKLNPREKQEVTGILKQKIESPHLKDLARNPMQLTILLSLIHVRGQSLPDQRTALYQSYIDVFFNREAEKTDVVRKNRQLLIDLHGYLAWKMHSDAELSRGDGRITAEELENLIRSWLTQREYRSDAVDELFEGIVQRIVAIVSRVEGTFEFEVQPLREYFAAHHLYHTAPYSPPGRPEAGTKPEILTALMDNPYWQNVLRFFAGFYSVGEIPGLASELIDRLEKSGSNTPLYDRVLSVNLLSDWVFHQQPIWTQKVVKSAVDDLTLRAGAVHPYSRLTDFQLNLPRDCGGTYVGRHAFTRLNYGRSRGLADIVRMHLPDHELIDLWLEEARTIAVSDVPDHIQKGRLLRITKDLSSDEITGLRKIWDKAPQLDELLISAGCSAAASERKTQLGLWSAAVDGNVLFRSLGGPWTQLSLFLEPGFLEDLLHRGTLRGSPDTSDIAGQVMMIPELSEKLKHLEDAFLDKLSTLRELTSWQKAVDEFSVEGKPTYAAHVIANAAAGITSSTERGAGAKDLFDISVPLTRRVRFARMRPSNTKWWKSQFDNADSDLKRSAWALHLLTWANDDVLLELVSEIAEAVRIMPSHQFGQLLKSVAANGQRRPSKPSARREAFDWPPEDFSVLFLFAARGNRDAQDKAIEHCRSSQCPSWASSSIQSWILSRLNRVPTAGQWRSAIGDLARFDVFDDHSHSPRWLWGPEPSGENLSEALAQKILSDPLRMPVRFLNVALSRLARQNRPPKALGKIAAASKWASG